LLVRAAETHTVGESWNQPSFMFRASSEPTCYLRPSLLVRVTLRVRMLEEH